MLLSKRTQRETITRKVMEKIARGEWVDTIPGMRELSADFDVAYQTMLNIRHDLQLMGLIDNRGRIQESAQETCRQYFVWKLEKLEKLVGEWR